jgi:DNA invertase Pin-like site-specific DNA recombinase
VVVHVAAAPGVVIRLTAWMLDSAVCAGMTFGAPRVTVSALADLHQLLTERGFRQSSLGNPTIVPEQQYVEPTDAGAVISGPTPAQHPVRFGKAWRDGQSERRTVLVRLASLLLERRVSRPQSVMMTSADLLPAAVLRRKAVVYIRQSTPGQVQSNLESQRRQYELVDVARRRGFTEVEVIDDDLGRSASRTVARPGFEQLVAWLCPVLDASRLARNGCDWHHLLELCGLFEARVIDLEGVYDPCRPNDKLLLGMKGSISEFELGVLRARMLDAIRAKARRGELRISVPIGYIWLREMGLGFDPDLRIQQVIRLIFARFRELGSARQVRLSMAAEQVHFPRPSDGKTLVAFEWTPIRYCNVVAVLKNPFYAGAYAYGKGEKRIEIVDGRARTSYRHRKPLGGRCC